MITKPSIKFCIAGLLLIAACNSSEPPDSKADKRPLPEIGIQAPTSIAPAIRRKFKSSPGPVKKKFLRAFERLQQDGEIRNEQIEAIMKDKPTTDRGQLIGIILAGDQNNDGELNASELQSHSLSDQIQNHYGRGRRDGFEGKLPIALADRDIDGALSAEEIRGFADLFVDMDIIIGNQELYSLMAFDSNQDGILTRTEIETEMNEIEPSKFVVTNFSPANHRSERQKAQLKIRNEDRKHN